nr:MAG TPA: hypothetical protein [Caudoviricetes sp.]
MISTFCDRPPPGYFQTGGNCSQSIRYRYTIFHPFYFITSR